MLSSCKTKRKLSDMDKSCICFLASVFPSIAWDTTSILISELWHFLMQNRVLHFWFLKYQRLVSLISSRKKKKHLIFLNSNQFMSSNNNDNAL